VDCGAARIPPVVHQAVAAERGVEARRLNLTFGVQGAIREHSDGVDFEGMVRGCIDCDSGSEYLALRRRANVTKIQGLRALVSCLAFSPL